jgi:DNA-binding transcriptional MerR regulator
MGLEQISFDFFNMPPEESKAVEKEQVKVAGKSKPPVDATDKKKVIEEVVMVVDSNIREVEFAAAKPTAKNKNIKKSTRGRMKLSDMNLMVDLVDVPEDELLFQKRYYGISEVSNMFKVNISLVRFWEKEFDILKPKKNGKGDRLFRPEDIKNLQLIYHLLREKKYTIDGAKDFLKKNKKAEDTFELIDTLKKTKAFLLDLKANL